MGKGGNTPTDGRVDKILSILTKQDGANVFLRGVAEERGVPGGDILKAAAKKIAQAEAKVGQKYPDGDLKNAMAKAIKDIASEPEKGQGR